MPTKNEEVKSFVPTATVTSSMKMLVPTVQYGNITLEASVTLSAEVTHLSNLQKEAHDAMLDEIRAQKAEVDNFEKGFFSKNSK